MMKWLICLLCSLTVHAAQEPKPDPKIDVLYSTVRVGDKTTQFRIYKDGKTRNVFIRHTSDGTTFTQEIQDKDIQFLKSEFGKLPTVEKVPGECYRSRIDIQLVDPNGKHQGKGSCLAGKTIAGPNYIRFANLLAMYR